MIGIRGQGLDFPEFYLCFRGAIEDGKSTEFRRNLCEQMYTLQQTGDDKFISKFLQKLQNINILQMFFTSNGCEI